jgi:hypothetical protein
MALDRRLALGHRRGMAIPVPRRVLFVDERGTGVRVSWHAERHMIVLSLWRDDVCVGTARLPVADAAHLAGFLVDHLGRMAAEASDSGA